MINLLSRNNYPSSTCASMHDMHTMGIEPIGAHCNAAGIDCSDSEYSHKADTQGVGIHSPGDQNDDVERITTNPLVLADRSNGADGPSPDPHASEVKDNRQVLKSDPLDNPDSDQQIRWLNGCVTTDLSYRWAELTVAALIRLEPQHADFFTEAPPATRHYICLCLAALHARPHHALPLSELAKRIATEPRRPMLTQLWGDDLGGLRLFGRLPKSVISEAAYTHLARMLQNPALRSVLHSFPELTANRIENLAHATEVHCRRYAPHSVAMLGVIQLDALVASFRAFRPDLSEAAILIQMRNLRKHDDVERLFAKLVRDLALPEPLWPGSDTIRPIRSITALRQAGRTFQNCLTLPSQWLPALRGDITYYLCAGSIPHIGSVRRHETLPIWHIDEINGVKNAKTPIVAVRAIEASLIAAGYHPSEAACVSIREFGLGLQM